MKASKYSSLLFIQQEALTFTQKKKKKKNGQKPRKKNWIDVYIFMNIVLLQQEVPFESYK